VQGRSVVAGFCVASALCSLALTACILKADGFTSPPDAGADGSGSSGAAASSGSGSSGSSGQTLNGNDGGSSSGSTSSGGANVLTNGDFELGCAGWDVAFGFVSEATDVVHGGTKSCKFCMDTNFEATLTRDATVAVAKGDTYAGDVWIHAAGTVQSMKSAGYSGSALIVAADNEKNDATDGPPLDGSWQHMTSLQTMTRDNDAIRLVVHLQQQGNPAAQGDVICVYVDDANLHKL
jgi:hypothetical protein